jgi:hypothetical protein
MSGVGRRWPASWQALEEGVQLRREVARLAHAPCPVVGHLRERRVERVPRLVDELGQRRVEVLVLALAEAMTAHVDGGAEARVFVEARGQLAALRRAVDRRRLREAALVELRGQRAPVEGRDAVGDGLVGDDCHARSNARAGRGVRSPQARLRPPGLRPRPPPAPPPPRDRPARPPGRRGTPPPRPRP